MHTEKKYGTRVFWGIAFILAAVALILSGLKIGFFGGTVGITQIVLGILLVAAVVKLIVDGKCELLPFPLAFLFMVFEKTIAYCLNREGSLISNWLLLFAAALLSLGLSFLLRGSKKKVEVSRDGVFGSSALYFDAADLSSAVLHDIVGTTDAYVVNRRAYPGGGVIRVHDVCGKVKVHMPADWLVVTNREDCVGKIKIPAQEDRFYEKTITLAVSDCVGDVEVVFD